MNGETATSSNAFTTNNQDDGGATESDVVTSDGTYIFAASQPLGNILVVVDARSGKNVDNVTMPAIPSDSTGDSTAQIQAVLSVKNRLVVVVTGYGPSLQAGLNTTRQPTIDGFLATRVQMYDTSSLANGGNLLLLKETNINGDFLDAHLIGSYIHILTGSFSISTPSLERLDRSQAAFAGLSDHDYILAATKIAEEETIPNFVDQLVDDLYVNGKIDMARVDPVTNNEFSRGLLDSSLVQVASFHVMDAADNWNLSLSGVFTPHTWGACKSYSTDNMLVLTNPVLTYDISNCLLFLVFKLDGASATLHAVSSLDSEGQVIAPFPASIAGGYMRIATIVETSPADLTSSTGDSTIHVNSFVTIFEIPSVSGSNATEMKVVLQSKSIGIDGDSLTAFNFFDTIAYGMSFNLNTAISDVDEQDYHVIDLKDPRNPKVMGSLTNIPGGSTYFLHSINSANTLILAISQIPGIGADALLTLFDASDPTNPVALHIHIIEYPGGSSTADMELKPFRVLSLTNDTGLAIVPMVISDANFTKDIFDGFIVFDVSKDGIFERNRIVDEALISYWSCGFFSPPRSFILNSSNVVTLKGPSFVSTDLNTGKQNWNLTLPLPASCGIE